MPTRPPRQGGEKRPWCHGGMSRHERGYGYQWVKLRDAFMAQHPVCADPDGLHVGRVVPSEHCDHIVPKSRGGLDLWDNLQALCVECHKHKTIQEQKT